MDLLRSGGKISQLRSEFESRTEQLEMARAVEEAIDNQHHLIVEAGTGVGKSFAYLIPAMIASKNRDKFRIIISTHTIHLQEQIIRKDIPFLQQLFDEPIKVVLVKGRSNYLSLRRLRIAQSKQNTLFSSHKAMDELTEIGRWSRRTNDGSRSDLPFQPGIDVWRMVESDASNCMAQKCRNYENCFFFKNRRKLQQSEIMIVNHALFFTDLALRRNEDGFLPDYNAVIFDEAHTIEDVASEHLGLRFSQTALENFLNRLFSPKTKTGILTMLGDEPTIEQLNKTRNQMEIFFDELQKKLGSMGNSNRRIRTTNFVENTLSEELLKLNSYLEACKESLSNEEDKLELSSSMENCQRLEASLTDWLNQENKGDVYWVECNEANKKVNLLSAAIDIAPILKTQLFDKVPSVIFTSATLSIGAASGLDYFQKRIGSSDSKTKKVFLGSPFDFASQVELYLFKQFVDPSNNLEYEKRIIQELPKYIQKKPGGTMVLFTSYQFLKRVAEHLQTWLKQQGMTLFKQGEGVGSNQLIQEFSSTPRAVLFGVDTFWQGIDIRGQALTNVIITKLPFQVPDRPLAQAREELIKTKGGNAFMELSVPHAIIKLKQGFGRLIRSKSDSGSVVIFDPRILTKAYGRSFIQALPICQTFIDGVRVDKI